MIFVDIPAGAVACPSAARENADVVAIGDTEQLFVTGCDKPGCPVWPFPCGVPEIGQRRRKDRNCNPVIGIAPEQIGVLGRPHLKAVLGAVVSLKLSLRVLIAVFRHAVPAEKQPRPFPAGC